MQSEEPEGGRSNTEAAVSTVKIPQAELEMAAAQVADAYTLAHAGEVDTGYACLREALDQAEQRAEGEAWGPALRERYRTALRYYALVKARTVE